MNYNVNHSARHVGRRVGRMEQKTVLPPKGLDEVINIYLTCSTFEMETQWEI